MSEIAITLITISEAAQRAAVHHGTVRRWIREGRLWCYRIDGTDYVQVAEVLEVERERRNARNAEKRRRA